VNVVRYRYAIYFNVNKYVKFILISYSSIEKTTFAEVFKNLARYRSENINFVWVIKIIFKSAFFWGARFLGILAKPSFPCLSIVRGTFTIEKLKLKRLIDCMLINYIISSIIAINLQL